LRQLYCRKTFGMQLRHLLDAVQLHQERILYNCVKNEDMFLLR
jgi:hypothetical protein